MARLSVWHFGLIDEFCAVWLRRRRSKNLMPQTYRCGLWRFFANRRGRLWLRTLWTFLSPFARRARATSSRRLGRSLSRSSRRCDSRLAPRWPPAHPAFPRAARDAAWSPLARVRSSSRDSASRAWPRSSLVQALRLAVRPRFIATRTFTPRSFLRCDSRPREVLPASRFSDELSRTGRSSSSAQSAFSSGGAGGNPSSAGQCVPIHGRLFRQHDAGCGRLSLN